MQGRENHKIKLDEETWKTHQKDMNTRNMRENDNKNQKHRSGT